MKTAILPGNSPDSAQPMLSLVIEVTPPANADRPAAVPAAPMALFVHSRC